MGAYYPGQGWFVRNGRSPGVPDKSSRGLGSMSWYTAHILICFIAHIPHPPTPFFIPLWVWLGTLQDCQYAQCPLPLSIVIRMGLVIRQSKLPACLGERQLAHQNTPSMSKQFSIKIVKYQDGMLILGQNDIFCGRKVVNLSVWFLQLTVLVANHVTEPGSLLTEQQETVKENMTPSEAMTEQGQ